MSVGRTRFPAKTEEEFKAWLRSLPPETTFCHPLRVDCCPIARFTGVGTWLLTDIPEWAQRFMDRYDEISGDTLQQALDCINS